MVNAKYKDFFCEVLFYSEIIHCNAYFVHSCVCPKGFEGRNCEVNVDDCASNPCYNNGTCIDLVSGYECVCAKQYSGAHCETSEYSSMIEE